MWAEFRMKIISEITWMRARAGTSEPKATNATLFGVDSHILFVYFQF